MNDREYVQDESETIELVIWEEWVSWARSQMESEKSQPNIEDTSCTDSQRE
jgi:hypothetical protein